MRLPTFVWLAVILLLTAASANQLGGESTLSDAGNWAAIGAFSVALLLLIGGLVSWHWRSHTCIDLRLHIDDGQFFPESIGDGSSSALNFGIRLKSSADVPIYFRVQEFTARVAGQSFPVTAELPFEEIGPGQERSWWRHPLTFPATAFPMSVEFEFVVHYGRSRRWRGLRMRRRLNGGFGLIVPLIGRAEPYSIMIRQLRPTQDEKLT